MSSNVAWRRLVSTMHASSADGRGTEAPHESDGRSRRGSFALGLLRSALPIIAASIMPIRSVLGQSITPVNSAACAMRMEPVVTLESHGNVLPYSTEVLVQWRSHYLLSHTFAPKQILMFDTAGTFTRSIRISHDDEDGAGRIAAMQVGAADSIYVFDAGRRRLTVLGPSLEVERRVDLPAVNLVRDGLTVLGDDSILLNGMVETAGQIGIPIHVMTRAGEIVTSFGGRDEAFTGALEPYRRRISAVRPEAIWVADVHAYVVELYSLDGNLEARLEQGLPVGTEAKGQFRPELMSIRQDDNGLVWVLIRVPKRPVPGDAWWPRPGRPAESPFRTVVDILRPNGNGEVVSRCVFDMFPLKFVAEDLLATYDGTDDPGKLRIWRVRAELGSDPDVVVPIQRR